MAGKKNLDDRQIKFLAYYLDPKSETYSNAYQSAIRAKYSEKYADKIVSLGNDWIVEASRKRELMLVKAEKNLDEFLEMDIVNRGVTKDGKEIYEFDDTGKIKVKADITKFIAGTIGKKHYSPKSPLEDDEGKNILKPLADTMRKLSEKK